MFVRQVITLSDAIELLNTYIGANQDAKQRINLVCERYLECTDCAGSVERVTFLVATDANGEGYIGLPARYHAIRGSVKNPTSTAICGDPLEIRGLQYEYAPGNLGMLAGSDPLRGIIPIPMAEGDTTRLYKVPVCPSVGTDTYFTCICKLSFQMLSDDDAVLPVQNLGALKLGLKALDKEDAEDFTRANQLWSNGKILLAEQKDNETGSQALGKVQFDDDFMLGYLGNEYCGYG